MISNGDERRCEDSTLRKTSPKIVFYSPLGANMLAHRIGGAEAGCRRTVEVLEKLGFQLTFVPKPTRTEGIFGYLTDSIKSLITTTRALLHKDIPLIYVIGYYDKNIYLEWLIMRIARILGKKVVYEPKNGNLLTTYQNGGRVYRFFLKNAVKCAFVVFCQGTCYVDFLEETYGANCVYIPNYVMQRYLTPSSPSPLHTPCELLFFGRLGAEKNVGMMLEISKCLSDKGVENRLTLIGACDAEYRVFLDREIERLQIASEQIRFVDKLEFDKLASYLRTEDFFLFPSVNVKEGHSNAVTEAMAFGVIPIASEAGFNRDVISDDRLIVTEMNAEAYADRVIDLISNSDAQMLREKVITRVRENYSEEIVTARMKQALDMILEQEGH